MFCTGRDLASIAACCKRTSRIGLAAPHLVISDVGCTVACGCSLAPVPLAVDPIEAALAGRGSAVDCRCYRDSPASTQQPLHSERRLAYYVDPERFDHGLIPQLEAHGVDCLVSDNRYLDLLPAGVNKGSTLMALLEWLEVDRSTVVTAGDTLNDLAHV